jgi:hypothetical protein
MSSRTVTGPRRSAVRARAGLATANARAKAADTAPAAAYEPVDSRTSSSTASPVMPSGRRPTMLAARGEAAPVPRRTVA